MKKILIFLFWSNALSLNAQQIYPIKETYDQILEPHYSSSDYNDVSVSWWHTWGFVLHSYLKMYETTGDKAYLNKFVKHSYGIQLRRGSSTPDWSAIIPSEQQMLYTGTLLSPMAEFIYIVKNDVELYNTNLLSGLVPTELNGPNQIILGYGDYANWLQNRVVSTMDYINTYYWLNDENCFTNSSLNSFNDGQNFLCNSGISECVNCPKWAAINFQTGYVLTLFYIGFVDPNYSHYTLKAVNIVSHFRDLVLEYLSNQSFTWFHNENQFNCSTPYREDVSHGAIDIQIPLIAYRLYGNSLFQWDEMNKFAHTFTYNIWDRENQLFHNNVFGTDYDIDPEQNICDGSIQANGSTNFYSAGEILAWMPLYKFDDFNVFPDDIYNILVNQTVKLLTDDASAILPLGHCSNTTRNLSGPQSFFGLSEVVKAQWDKECINLTLYNRDVVYNQDFLVKNKLVVSPQLSDNFYQAGVDDPFAEPKTFSDNGMKDRFVVEQGTTVNFVAGESATFKPGTHLKAGSIVHAYIDPNYCTDGMKGLNASNEKMVILKNDSTENDVLITGNDKKRDSLSHSQYERSFKLYPNPTEDKFIIESDEKIVEITILNQLGYEIEKMDVSINELSMQDYSNGIYWIKIIFENNEEKVVKMVKI